MPELIRMKALKPWLNREYEGDVSEGLEFNATEDRARELERNGFAVRIRVIASQEKPEEKTQEPPVEFARKDIGEPAERQARRPRSKRG